MIKYLILWISLGAPIWPVNIEVIKTGLKYGFPSAFLLALWAVLADITYMLIIYYSWLSNFVMIQIIRNLILLFGAFVLFYLWYQWIKESFQILLIRTQKNNSNKNVFFIGYIIAISNPMTMVWWVGVYWAVLWSLTIKQADSLILLNSFIIIVGLILWFFMLSIMLHRGKRFINENSMKYISLISGISLIWFWLYFLNSLDF